VYGVEKWIRQGLPLQLSEEALAKHRRKRSALEIALECENRALALLLLCNGYDPNLESDSPLNIGLVHHAGRGNARGVQLCLWAWADPHAEAPSLRYSGMVDEDDSENEDDRFIGWSAVYEACLHGHVDILKRLGPDPARDDFDDLYGAAEIGGW